MYQMHYQDVMDDGVAEAKQTERFLFDRSIELLSEAKIQGARSAAKVEAFYFTNRLWTVLMEDLASPSNALAAETRAALISVGIFVIKELERIRLDQSEDYDSIISITSSIRDGL